eukprot:Hpha_TRINITY_DN16808_c0_g6::TRINITY_DN16808_c0_g6_i1::g.149083::m.149083
MTGDRVEPVPIAVPPLNADAVPRSFVDGYVTPTQPPSIPSSGRAPSSGGSGSVSSGHSSPIGIQWPGSPNGWQRKERLRSTDVLEKANRTKALETRSRGGVTVAAAAMQGWRRTMEDAHSLDFNSGGVACVGVYDGHSGPAVSKLASSFVPQQLKDIDITSEPRATCRTVSKAFIEVDRVIGESGELGGSTAAVALLGKDCLVCANLGDARCVLSREGKALPLTSDHKPTIAAEKMRITAAGAEVVEGRVTVPGWSERLAVSRAFGDFAYKRQTDKQGLKLPAELQPVIAFPDITVTELRPEDDFLILACDGLWEKLDGQTAVSHVRDRLQQGIAPVDICAQLCDLSCSETPPPGRGCDNITVALIVFAPTPPSGATHIVTTNTILEQQWTAERIGSIDMLSQPPSSAVEFMDDKARLEGWHNTGQSHSDMFGRLCDTTSICEGIDEDVGADRETPVRRGRVSAWSVDGATDSSPDGSPPGGFRASAAQKSSMKKRSAFEGVQCEDRSSEATTLTMQVVSDVPPEGFSTACGSSAVQTVSFAIVSGNPLSQFTSPRSGLSDEAVRDRLSATTTSCHTPIVVFPQLGPPILGALSGTSLGAFAASIFCFVSGAPGAGSFLAGLSIPGAAVLGLSFTFPKQTSPALGKVLMAAGVMHAVAADATSLGDLDGWALLVPWVVSGVLSFPPLGALAMVVLATVLLAMRAALRAEGVLLESELNRSSWTGEIAVFLVQLTALLGVIGASRGEQFATVYAIESVNRALITMDVDTARIELTTASIQVQKSLHSVIATAQLLRIPKTAVERDKQSTDGSRTSLHDGSLQRSMDDASRQSPTRSASNSRRTVMTRNSSVMRRSAPSSVCSSPVSGSGGIGSPRLRFFTELSEDLESSVLQRVTTGWALTTTRSKNASVFHANLVLDRIDSNDLGQATLFFASAVIDGANKHDGVIIGHAGSVVSVGWNTHNSCNTHAVHACNCALYIQQLLQPLDRSGNYYWFTIGITSGSLVCVTGEAEENAPYLVGQPMLFAETLSRLARQLLSNILVTDKVYTKARAQLFARPVDVINYRSWAQSLGLSDDEAGTDRSGTVVVYELVGQRDSFSTSELESHDFVKGFSSLRMLKFQDAREHFMSYLRETPEDLQAQRMLRMTVMNTDDAPGNHEFYFRSFNGWEDPEGRAYTMEVDDEIREMTAMNCVDSFGEDRGGNRSATRRRLHSVQHDVMLRRAIREAEAEANADQLAAWGIMPSSGAPSTPTVASNSSNGPPALPSRFTDFKGRLWQRANKCLGVGAFGEVWMGMGSEGGLVAIKCMRLPTLSSMKAAEAVAQAATSHSARRLAMANRKQGRAAAKDPNQVHLRHIEDLLSEVALMQQLHHENVVAYLGSALAASHIIIIMEYLSGGSLSSVMKEFKERLATPSIQRYLRDMVRGLSFLHSHEIIHRDMKPHNVLLVIDGQCKLADFGASAKLSQLSATNQGVIGTPLYMAPEACRGEASCPSDIWSLGVIVCELFSGHVPYRFSDSNPFTPQGFMYKVGRDETYTPTLPPEVPPEAIALVTGCLSRDPRLRPTADELLCEAFLLS